MPTFQHGDATIYYEEQGSGFPILLIAPGGMRSSVSAWRHAPWDVIGQLSFRYRVIAMDQRNAGQLHGPGALQRRLGHLHRSTSWRCSTTWASTASTWRACASAGRTSRRSPTPRPSGWPPGSSSRRSASTATARPSTRCSTAGPTSWPSRTRRSTTPAGRSSASRCTAATTTSSACPTPGSRSAATPLLVLLGNDMYHPESSSRRLAADAPNATLVERWREPEDHARGPLRHRAVPGRQHPGVLTTPAAGRAPAAPGGWTCPDCRRRFGRRHQSHDCAPALSLEEYFSTGPAHERPIFEVVRAHVETLGPCEVEAVSVGIFFKRSRSFAQLRPMQRWVALSFSLPRVVRHPLHHPPGDPLRAPLPPRRQPAHARRPRRRAAGLPDRGLP